MVIRLGYDIRFDVPYEASFLALLRVHPSRQKDLHTPDLVRVDPAVPVEHARHNRPRIGRVLMATGRDATDAAMTTSFGPVNLTRFTVITEEVDGAR